MRAVAFLTKRGTGATIGLLLVINSGSVGRAAVNGWTPSGPFGGHVRALTIDPSNPTTLYAGTQDGSVFKSTDRAAT